MRALLQDQHRDAFLGAGNAFPLAEQQVKVGHVAVGDEGLAAVDDDLVALLAEGRAHAGGVGSRTRFGDRQRAEAALGDARQQPLLLLLGAPVDQRLHAVVVGGPDDAGGGAGLADLAHAGEVGGVRHLRAAVGLGDEHGVQSQLVDRPDVLPGEFRAAVVVRGAGRDLLACERTHALQQHPLLVVEGDRRVESFEQVHAFNGRCLDRRPRRSFLRKGSRPPG